MSSPLWAARFGISDQRIAEIKNQLGAHDTPLRWLLANGEIPSDDYVHWAMDQYGLPAVRNDYFAIPVDHVYWDAVKDKFAWTPSFFPLTEWQGVMLIGCLEPPSFHFPMHLPHRFVVATAQALEHRFRELEDVTQKTQPLEPVVVAVEPAPEPLEDTVTTPIETSAPVAPQVRQRPPDEVLAENLPPAPDVNMKDPDGLVVEIDSSVGINFAVPDGMHVDDIGAPIPTAPDGLDQLSRVIDMESLDFSNPESMKEIKPEAPKAEPVKPTAPPVEVPRAPVVPPGPPAAVVAAQTETPAPSPIAPPPVPQTSNSNVLASEPVVPLATCATIDTLTSAAIAHVNLHFEHAVLFMYENAILRPSKWSELLLSVKGDHPDPISLEHPSIFRIAARTSLPYHGYVVANPTNTAFFNAFNRGILPKHVTVMPVMIAGQLTAMLMGLSMVDVDYKASLTAMEKIASDFSTQLERLRDKKEKAA